MKRVIVIGCAGSGKSTFSRQVGERTGLPVVHLDAYYWKPGWIATEAESFDRELQRMMQTDSWIMDGNYSRTLDTRLDRADTVFLFDFPRYLCLYRVIKRRVQYHGRSRADMGEGCQEKLDLAFLRWVWNFRKRNRPKLLAKLDEVRASHQVVSFRTPKEVRKYLAALREAE
ncbi:DNA topology modulation protein [Paenibacillus sp. GCM10012303]|uniref:DNA topology modulation protein n=1 Tax=Paenibacillus sp. GCM10012303 TaxID=3317340 RepID=UPI00360CA49A